MKRVFIVYAFTLLVATTSQAQDSTGLRAANIMYKVPIEGLGNSTQQFVVSVPGGKYMIGMDDAAMISDDNKVVWHYIVPAKGKFRIDCYALLNDNSLIVGGWNNNNKKSNWWILRLDPGGRNVWERSIPVKGGNILALAAGPDGKDFWAIGYERASKKEFTETAIQFDLGGNALDRIKLIGNVEVKDALNLSSDVFIFPDTKGFYVFGGTFDSDLTGQYYERGEQNGLPSNFSLIENNVASMKTLKGFVNFTIVRNPMGGFYAAYTSYVDSHSEVGPRLENYRLVAFDSSLSVLWSRDYGGDESDGASSLIVDDGGNPIIAGFSYSGVSGDKSEPAFEKDHCDVWIIKVNSQGEKIWDKTITGPGCILEAKLFNKDGKVGVIFKEETNMEVALIEEK